MSRYRAKHVDGLGHPWNSTAVSAICVVTAFASMHLPMK